MSQQNATVWWGAHGTRCVGFVALHVAISCQLWLIGPKAVEGETLSDPPGMIAGTRLQGSVPVEKLMGMLSSADQLRDFPKTFFESSYDRSLADLIFAFPDAGSRSRARIALVEDGKSRKSLSGARFVWVIAVRATHRGGVPSLGPSGDSSARDGQLEGQSASARQVIPCTACRDTLWIGTVEKRKEPSPTVRTERLDYQRGFAEVVFKDVVGGLVGVKSAEQGRGAADTTQALEWRRYGDANRDSIDFGMVKVALQENTINRVRVQTEADAQRTAYATFGNYEDSRLGASVALLGNVTVKKKHPEWSKLDAGPYALAKIYLVRPHLPSVEPGFKPRSLSIVLGVQVKELWNSYAAGLAAGHVIGGAGIILPAVNVKRVGSVWKSSVALGFDYAL